MARTAQQRLAAAQALGEDAPPSMEPSRRAALRRAEHATDRAYREGRDARRHELRARGARGLVRPGSLPDAYPADEADEHHDERLAYEAGADDALADERRRAASRAGDALTASKPVKRARNLTQTGSGLLLGMLAWALALSFLRDGPAGPKAWLRAKFLNDPSAAKKLHPSKAATPSLPTSTTTSPSSPLAFAPIPAVPSTPLAPAGPG